LIDDHNDRPYFPVGGSTVNVDIDRMWINGRSIIERSTTPVSSVIDRSTTPIDIDDTGVVDRPTSTDVVDVGHRPIDIDRSTTPVDGGKLQFRMQF